MLLKNKTKNIIIFSSFVSFFACFVILFFFTSPSLLYQETKEGDIVQVSPNDSYKYKMENRVNALKHISSYYLPIITAIIFFLFGSNKKDDVHQEIITHDADMARPTNIVALFVSAVVFLIPIFFHLTLKIEDANNWVLNCQIPVQAALSPIFSYYFGVGIKGNSSK